MFNDGLILPLCILTGEAIGPVAVAVGIQPDIEIGGRAQLLEVIHRDRGNGDPDIRRGGLAVRQVAQAGAIIKAVIVGIVGRRDDVVERVLIGADIGVDFAADPLAQMEGTRVEVAGALG